MASIEKLSPDELKNTILQYCIFPKNIISILYTAVYNLNYYDFTKTSKELIQNINEELGVYTDETVLVIPRPHYTVLRKGIFEGLGIDINHQSPSNSTEKFIRKLKQLSDDKNPYKICGSIYAIESSAILELNIVLKLVNHTFKLNNNLPPEYLVDFFHHHVNDIEIGHKNRFYESCTPYLKSEQDMVDFELGFHSVMKAMDEWWVGMYNERQG